MLDDQRIALITGGSSGLGLEFARQLYSQGYIVNILGRDVEKLNNAKQDIASDGKNIRCHKCDVTNDIELRSVYENISEMHGKIDFLIINAGRVTVSLLEQYTDAVTLKKDIEVNLCGTMLTAYTFIPLMKSGGKILTISSGFGLMGPAGYSAYAASKAGIINFAESLRRELLSKKINVYVTCPGDIDTPQLRDEIKSMPEWMSQNAVRKTLSPAVAARKILKKCVGNRFMVIINPEILALIAVNKLLPRRIRDFAIDKMFPRP